MKLRTVYLVSLIAFLSTPTLAQRGFSVGITATPAVSHSSSRITFTLPDQSGQLVDQTYDLRSTNWGYVAGGVLQYKFTSKWSVAGGFWYNRLSTESTFPFPVNGVSVPARVVSSSYRVPLTLNYRLTTRRLSPYFSAGALASFSRPTLYKPEAGAGLSDVKINFGKHKATVQALVGAGVWYQLNTHLSLIVQPTLIWAFRPNRQYERFVSYQINGQTQLLYSF